MSATHFVDTNILVYAHDVEEPVKRGIAREIIESGWTRLGEVALSVQVLQEFHVNLLRKGIDASVARSIVEGYFDWPVIENTVPILREAMRIQSMWQLSLWDALIVAAAKASGAATLLSEDMQHGQDFDGVTVLNPFRGR